MGARRPRPGRGDRLARRRRSAVATDAKAFLKAANERLLGGPSSTPRSSRRARRTTARIARPSRRRRSSTRRRGTGRASIPGRTITTLRRVLPDDAILTTDAGNFASWAGRGFRFRRPGTFLGPTSGAMGYGLPAAIAAALVHRDRPVVALVGDGGLGMTMAELETAVRVGARVVVVVFDNERYGTIRMWQERRGTGVGVASELGPVDFAAIARACGARGVRVERDADFEPALRAALVGGPARRSSRSPSTGPGCRSTRPRPDAPDLSISCPSRGLGGRGPGGRLRGRRLSGGRRLHPLHRWRRCPRRRRSTATTRRIRGRSWRLTLDLDALDVPWRYDVPGSPYPHIYGPIERSAIVAVSRVDRAPDGRFAGLRPPDVRGSR